MKANGPQELDRSDWEWICLDYLDNPSSSATLSFYRLLDEPGFCKLLAAHATELAELTSAQPFVASSHEGDDEERLAEWRCHEFLEGSCVTSPTRSTPQPLSARSTWLAPRLSRVAAAVAAVLILGVTAFLFSRRADNNRHQATPQIPVVQAVSWSGEIRINGAVAHWDRTSEGWIPAGSRIATDGGSGIANLRFADGSTIELSSDSSIVVDLRRGQKFIDVANGYVSASVEPQPIGKPMTISTTEATVEVVGTELAISRVPKATTLSVTGGTVRMLRKADGQLVEVKTGEYAVAADKSHEAFSKNYRAYELGDCPDEWMEDFELGLPDGWRSGEWVSSDLPIGSDGGAKASQVLEGDDYCVCTQVNEEVWKRGLVDVHKDTVLNIRMRMDVDEFYHIMLFARGHRHYEYQEPRRVRGQWIGKWRTLSIPLSHFKETSRENREGDDFQNRQTPAPASDRPVYMLMISTQKRDLGLTVDRIWVSRDISIEQPVCTAYGTGST